LLGPRRRPRFQNGDKLRLVLATRLRGREFGVSGEFRPPDQSTHPAPGVVAYAALQPGMDPAVLRPHQRTGAPGGPSPVLVLSGGGDRRYGLGSRAGATALCPFPRASAQVWRKLVG